MGISHGLLKEIHDAGDLLKKEGMVDIETLETFRAKKRGRRDRMRVGEKMEVHSDSENSVTGSTYLMLFINDYWRVNRAAIFGTLRCTHFGAKGEGH